MSNDEFFRLSRCVGVMRCDDEWSQVMVESRDSRILERTRANDMPAPAPHEKTSRRCPKWKWKVKSSPDWVL